MRSIADTAEERWIGTQMIDRKKVITGLGCLADENSACHSDCPYFTDREDGGFCFRKMAHDALELLKEQPEQEREHWISVKDSMPIIQNGQHGIIVCDAHKNVHLTKSLIQIGINGAILYFDDLHSGCFWTIASGRQPKYNTLIKGNEITHWMPLPEPPEEVAKAE